MMGANLCDLPLLLHNGIEGGLRYGFVAIVVGIIAVFLASLCLDAS